MRTRDIAGMWAVEGRLLWMSYRHITRDSVWVGLFPVWGKITVNLIMKIRNSLRKEEINDCFNGGKYVLRMHKNVLKQNK